MRIRLLIAFLVGLGVTFLAGFGVRADAAGAEPPSTTEPDHGRSWKTRREDGRRSAGVDGPDGLPMERGDLRLGCLAPEFPPRFSNWGATDVRRPRAKPARRLSSAPAAAVVSDGTTSAAVQARARVASAASPPLPQTALSPPPEGAKEKTKEGAHFLPVPPFYLNVFLAASGIIIIVVAFFAGRLRKNQRHGSRGGAGQRSSRLSADSGRAAADEALKVLRDRLRKKDLELATAEERLADTINELSDARVLNLTIRRRQEETVAAAKTAAEVKVAAAEAEAEAKAEAAAAAAASASAATEALERKVAELCHANELLTEERQRLKYEKGQHGALRDALEHAQRENSDKADKIAKAEKRRLQIAGQLSAVGKENAAIRQELEETNTIRRKLEETVAAAEVAAAVKARASKATAAVEAAAAQAEAAAAASASAATEALESKAEELLAEERQRVRAQTAEAATGAASVSPAAAGSHTLPGPPQQDILFPPSPNTSQPPPSSMSVAATASDEDDDGSSGTESAAVGQGECPLLCDAAGESMLCKKKPLVGRVYAWSNRSIKIDIDNDGNCYPCSWVLSVFLWAIQRQETFAAFDAKLQKHTEPGGAFNLIPPEYERFVDEFLKFVSDQGRNRHSAHFGPDVVVRVLEALKGDLASGAGRGASDEEWPRHARLKWGMGLVGRALDVSWAFQNSFPGTLADLAAICESVEFDVGAETLISESLQGASDEEVGADMMRPGCGLGYLVGMEAEFILGSGEDKTEDFSEAFIRAAKRGPDPSQSYVNGFRVVKVGGNHYEVRLDRGDLADHLARAFTVHFDNSDVEARATMSLNARWASENAKPDLEALFSAKDLDDARRAEGLLLGVGPGPSVAAAASSSALSSQTDEAYARALVKQDKDALRLEKEEQEAASMKLIHALEDEEKKNSGNVGDGGEGDQGGKTPWSKVPKRGKRKKKQKAKGQVVATFGSGGARR